MVDVLVAGMAHPPVSASHIGGHERSTRINVGRPPPLAPLAFIAAMAGLDSPLAGGLAHADQASWVCEPTLVNPRIMAV